MGSWSYRGDEIKLHFKNKKETVDTTMLIMPGEWKFLEAFGEIIRHK